MTQGRSRRADAGSRSSVMDDMHVGSPDAATRVLLANQSRFFERR
jgi:hypothetical protein